MKKLSYYLKKISIYNLRIFLKRKKLDLIFLFNPKVKIIYELEKNCYIFLNKDEISYLLYTKGEFENTNRALFKTLITKGMVFFDIGANFGLYSIIASKLTGETGKIYSFEPNKNEVKKFNKNLKLNRTYTKNINLIEKAVGSYSGKTFFFIPESYKGAYGSIKKPNISENCSKVELAITSIDEFVESNDITKIDLIKIDVEGNELDVLKGAIKSIHKFKPIILMEVSDRRTKVYGYKAKELCDILLNLKYKLFLPRFQKNKIKLKNFEPKDFISYEDIFAIPIELEYLYQDFFIIKSAKEK